MPPGRPFRHLALRIRRHLAVEPMLIGFLVVALGVPLPLPSVKDTRIPFPCQHHRCGCQSAEECWRHCCCFTLEQRLAWARANQVEPPTFVLEARQEENPSPREDAE